MECMVKAQADIKSILATTKLSKNVQANIQRALTEQLVRVDKLKVTSSSSPETIYIRYSKPRAQAHVDRRGVLTTRVYEYLPGIITLTEELNFGNPFKVESLGGAKGATAKVVSLQYYGWLEGKNNTNQFQKQRAWINKQIDSGKLDNVPLIYWKKTDELPMIKCYDN